MGTKVDKENPTDLLPKVTAEKMTWRLLRGCQLYLKVNRPLSIKVIIKIKKNVLTLNNTIEKILLTRAYLPSSKGLTSNLSAASMSFSQL